MCYNSIGDEMDRNNIEKIARTPEDKLLLAKIWDKIHAGVRKNIAASSCFLSPRELEMTRYLFGQLEGLTSFGGYDGAERQMLIYLPEYLDDSTLISADSPIICLRASFYEDSALTHRDLLGGLMGAGITRDSVGDICVGTGSCDFFVTAQIAPYVLQNCTSAGRTHLHLQAIPLEDARIPEPETKQIADTLSSLRLDSVISTGFRISRSQAVQYITSGKAAINGLPCEKPDKAVDEGAKISVRGLGKIKLSTVKGQTKKGRISVVIDRYV